MRVLARFCAAFAFAVLLAQYFPRTISIAAATVLCAVLTAVLLLRRERRMGAALLLGGLLVGMVYNFAYAAIVQAPMKALAGREETLLLEACEYPRAAKHGEKVTVRVCEPALLGKAIFYGDTENMQPGTRFHATVSCVSADTIRGEQVDTFTSDGVFLLLYGRGEVTVERDAGHSFRYLPQRLARYAAETIDEIFPESTAPLMRALLLGDKSKLGMEESVDLSESGLFHITAVSGLHCAFLLMLITFLFRGLNRRFLALAAIPILVFYTLMTGASPSVVRACIMLSLLLIGPIFYRESDSLTSLFFALLLILLHNPFAIKSVSLQLSFASMAGIFCLTPMLQKKIRERDFPRAVQFVLRSFAMTAGALLFTVPLCAWYFGYVSIVSPLSNLLCLSAASVVFGGGAAAAAAGMIFLRAGKILAAIVHYGALFLLTAARILAGLPYHALYFENPYLRLWLVYVYLLFLGCILLRRGKYRYLLAALCAVLTLTVSVALYADFFRSGRACFAVTDVGQGQSIVLISDGESAVIDCGSANFAADAGNLPADILYNAGCGRIDHLCLTHYDADHINGLERLAARIAIGEIIVPYTESGDERQETVERIAAAKKIPVRYAEEKTTLSVGEADVTVYPPMSEDGSNERGNCYLCTVGDFDLLVTGDIRTETEKQLAETYALPDIEVLIAGHHGSKTSTGEALLTAVSPEVGIVSVGSNSYGHPTHEALGRMASHGMAVYRTDRCGNIYITVN